MFKKEYTNGEITVIWQPGLCIHSGVCFRGLPHVFRPMERPWIQMENSDSRSIEATVLACPSGALTIKEKDIQPVSEASPSVASQHIQIMANGPVRFKGPSIVMLPDGITVEKPNGVAICRCGGSAKYPFCDGSHRTNGFKG